MNFISIRKLIINFSPPIIISLLDNLLKIQWRGNYRSWDEAQSKTTTYSSKNILKKVHESLYKVKIGQSVYERDSVLFEEIQYSWPLLAGLMIAAAKLSGKIHVLDFGGSLGSTYFQNKKFLDQFDDFKWSVVEQKHFVKVGKTDFEDEKLKFYLSVEDCLKEQSIDVLIFSSVLQYLEHPYEYLKNLISQTNAKYILFDRPPFTKRQERIVIQTVPSNIYKASYPCHIFNKIKFMDHLSSLGYSLLEEFNSVDRRRRDIQFKGFIYFSE